MNYRIYTRKRLNNNSFFDKLTITNWIILINILFFIIVFIILFYNKDFLDYIALKPLDFLLGIHSWTILTYMFMHHPFFIFHLVVNMFSIFFLGNFIEKLIGKKRFLIFYLLSGIFSGLIFVLMSYLIGNSYFFGTGMEISAVGASGALFALAGLMTMLTPNIPLIVFPIPFPIKAKYAVPGLLVALALISLSAKWPIGNIAHFGGFLCGLFYGLYLRIKYKRKTRLLGELFSS